MSRTLSLFILLTFPDDINYENSKATENHVTTSLLSIEKIFENKIRQ